MFVLKSFLIVLCSALSINAVPFPTGYVLPHPDVKEAFSSLIVRRTARLLPLESLQLGVAAKASALQPLVELDSSRFPLIYNQGSIGSCTANATAWAIKYLYSTNGLPEIFPSRLGIYSCTRGNTCLWFGMSMTIQQKDTGTSLAATLLTIDELGIFPENPATLPNLGGGRPISVSWPYLSSNFVFPTSIAFTLIKMARLGQDSDGDGFNTGTLAATRGPDVNPYALVAQSLMYQDLLVSKDIEQTLQKIEIALGKNYAIVAGILVPNTIYSAKKGFIPPASTLTKGGHAIAFVGIGFYNADLPDQKYIKFVNSWGAQWGDKGYGYIPICSWLGDALQEVYSMWLPR